MYIQINTLLQYIYFAQYPKHADFTFHMTKLSSNILKEYIKHCTSESPVHPNTVLYYTSDCAAQRNTTHSHIHTQAGGWTVGDC